MGCGFLAKEKNHARHQSNSSALNNLIGKQYFQKQSFHLRVKKQSKLIKYISYTVSMCRLFLDKDSIALEYSC